MKLKFKMKKNVNEQFLAKIKAKICLQLHGYTLVYLGYKKNNTNKTKNLARILLCYF